MSVVPYSFLVRQAYPCPHVKSIPLDDDSLLDLPESARIDTLFQLDEQTRFADVRFAWNEGGIGFQVEVRGKEQSPVGDMKKPLSSDRVSLWIDTRDARGSHRATRFCHQFHFLPVGGGAERDEPFLVQQKINRALDHAPVATSGAIPFRCRSTGGGYRLEVFLPASVLNGFDPSEYPRLGFHYLIRDQELGEQSPNVPSRDFPVAEDPSLWSILELQAPIKAKRKKKK